MIDLKKPNSSQLKVLNSPGHKKPQSRREFIAAGLLGGTAILTAPTFLQMILAKTAKSSDEAAGQLLPFLVFDCAGGPGFPGNFLVKDKGGQLLPSYSQLGWNPRAANALDERFGLPMAANGVSQILNGMRQTAGDQALKGLQLGSFCHFSIDDQTINLHQASSLVAMAGLKGEALDQPLGFVGSNSGGKTDVPKFWPEFKPMEVTRIDDVLDAISGGGYFKKLDRPSRKAFFEGMARYYRLQLERFTQSTSGPELEALVMDAGAKNSRIIDVEALDPRKNTMAAASYGLTATTNGSTQTAREAIVALSVLTRQCGPGVIVINDCDYHDSTQTKGDAKDLEIGQAIGRAISLASKLKQKFVFQLLADGGVVAQDNTRKWTGDAGDKSMTIMGFYDPVGAPKLKRTQVGHYTNGQGADTDTIIGRNTRAVGFATLANYLVASGREDLIERMVDRSVLPSSAIQEILFL